MNSDNKQIRDVADVAARIMAGLPVTEKLHPNQQVLDVHEPEKDELTADDFKKLRAKKEVKKEEVESIDEVKMADLPSTKVQGRAYGASKPEPHALDVMKGPTEKQLLGVKSEKKKKFSEMVNLYQDGGMKSFMEALSKEEEDEIIDEVSKEIADYTMDVIDAGEYTEVTIGEEASQDEFNAEIEKAKAKSQGKVKAEVAKAAVQAVKQEEVELGEDRMNDAEKAKREDIVKGMKKGMAGFKERYGARAKNVMYATATKQAMKN